MYNHIYTIIDNNFSSFLVNFSKFGGEFFRQISKLSRFLRGGSEKSRPYFFIFGWENYKFYFFRN